MNRAERKRFLERLGFELLRHGKRHDIYVHPTGVRAILGHAPGELSDPRSWRNEIARLKREGVIP